MLELSHEPDLPPCGQTKHVQVRQQNIINRKLMENNGSYYTIKTEYYLNRDWAPLPLPRKKKFPWGPQSLHKIICMSLQGELTHHQAEEI